MGVAYLRQVNGFINDIAEIAEANDDPKWRPWLGCITAIMCTAGSLMGRQDYREAKEMLIEVGIDEARLEAFFSADDYSGANFFIASVSWKPFSRRRSLVSCWPKPNWKKNQTLGISRFISEPSERGSRGSPLFPCRCLMNCLRTDADLLVDAKFRASSGRVSGVKVLRWSRKIDELRRKCAPCECCNSDPPLWQQGPCA